MTGVATLLLAMAGPEAVAARASPAASPVPEAATSASAAAADLAPGRYFWRDTNPTEGEIAVIIDRAAQRAYVYRGERLIGAASVSTGKPGKRTPLGDFTILQKRVFHRSNLYSNAPMPYMQRLTWDGIALHAGHNPGYPASHGCIRLPHTFATLLYGVTRLGAAVAVVDGDGDVPVPVERFPLIVVDLGGFGGDGFAEVTWRPASGRGLVAPDGLRVMGDEAMVPDAPLAPPPFRRRL